MFLKDKESTNISRVEKNLQITGFEDIQREIIIPLLNFFENKCNSALGHYIDQQLKLRVFNAVGAYRIYRIVVGCNHTVAKIWKGMLKDFGFEFQ